MPEALITAELATTFPENSGFVAWVTAAFGPFWGFQKGTLGGLWQLLRVMEVAAGGSQLPSGTAAKPSPYIYARPGGPLQQASGPGSAA